MAGQEGRSSSRGTMQARILDLSPLRVRPVGPVVVFSPISPSPFLLHALVHSLVLFLSPHPVIKLQSFRLQRGVADRSANNGGFTERTLFALQTYMCAHRRLTQTRLAVFANDRPNPPLEILGYRDCPRSTACRPHKQSFESPADIHILISAGRIVDHVPMLRLMLF